jgi:hypothetical protein
LQGSELGATRKRVAFIGASENHEIWNLIGLKLRNIRAEAEILAPPRKKSLAFIGMRESLEIQRIGQSAENGYKLP